MVIKGFVERHHVQQLHRPLVANFFALIAMPHVQVLVQMKFRCEQLYNLSQVMVLRILFSKIFYEIKLELLLGLQQVLTVDPHFKL